MPVPRRSAVSPRLKELREPGAPICSLPRGEWRQTGVRAPCRGTSHGRASRRVSGMVEASSGLSERRIKLRGHVLRRFLLTLGDNPTTYMLGLSGPLPLTKRGGFSRQHRSHGDIDALMLQPDGAVQPRGAGFCPRGEAGRFVEAGTLRLGGKLLLNTDGGHLRRSTGWSCTTVPLAGKQGSRRPPCVPAV